MAELSRRPYLLRAMVEWMVDSGHTPHAIVDANYTGVEVPRAFVNDGRIVLNISSSATQALTIGPDHMEFNARFSGVDAAAITRAPSSLPICTAAIPTPPAAPSTRSCSPAPSDARALSA